MILSSHNLAEEDLVLTLSSTLRPSDSTICTYISDHCLHYYNYVNIVSAELHDILYYDCNAYLTQLFFSGVNSILMFSFE